MKTLRLNDTQISLRVPKPDAQRLSRMAAEMRLSRTDLLRMILGAEFKRQDLREGVK